MKLNRKYGLSRGMFNERLSLMLIFFLLCSSLFCQETKPKATRQSALDAFKKGDYELAYNRFNELLTVFPGDPVYKYYSGVCLVKMERDPEKAIEFLSQAIKGGSVIRTVPPDALFWLGRAQQMAGMFTEALSSFNAFTEQAGRKAAKELGTPEYIRQCMDKKGQITQAAISAPAEETKGKSEVRSDKEVYATSETGKTKKEIQTYKPPASEVGTKKHDTNSVKTLLKPGIDTLKSVKAGAGAMPSEKNTQDTTFKELPDKHVAEAVKQPSTSGVLMLFTVKSVPLNEKENKIQINPKHPAGLIYRIQIAVFRNPVTYSYFKGITPVYGIRNPASSLTTYYAGMFRKFDDAKKALLQVKQKGFKDAFVVAFSGGRPVSLERAAILEKEWGMIPFTPDEVILNETQADTIPPTLSFRVEVIRTSKPVSEQSYEALKKLSGTRGMDIETLPDGTIVYLIGQFITYESAENYADLLVRNGYRDAKVVAWLGKKEIPVETAKQLFKSLE